MAEMKFWDKDPMDTEITLITPAITNFLISEVGKSRFDLKFVDQHQQTFLGSFTPNS